MSDLAILNAWAQRDISAQLSSLSEEEIAEIAGFSGKSVDQVKAFHQKLINGVDDGITSEEEQAWRDR